MKFRPTIRSGSLPVLAVTLLAAACMAQTTPAQNPTAPPPCPSSGQTTGKPAADKPCVPPADPKQPPASQQFPFPGEPAKPLSSSDTPDTQPPSKPHSTAADEHPFPTQTPPPMYDTDSSSSSSSSSSSNSSANDSSNPDDPDAPSSAPWADKAASTRTTTRHKLPKVDPRTDDDRVTEDLSVAKFYEDRGDFNAAYMRAKDAVKAMPKDAESHFVLGHIAQKLQKRDEAIAEFNTYLQLEPDGDKVKQARKALTQLQ